MAVARYQLNTSVPRAAPFDFDGDGKSDVSVYRADTENASSLSYWHLIRSSDNQLLIPHSGTGKTRLFRLITTAMADDLAVFRPALGNWYFTSDLLNSQQTSSRSTGDKTATVPRPGL